MLNGHIILPEEQHGSPKRTPKNRGKDYGERSVNEKKKESFV